MHESLFSLGERAATAVGIPALCCIFQCVIFGLFSEYYFYIPFSVSVVLKAVLTPIIILSKSETEISNKLKGFETPLKTCQHKNVQIKGIVSHTF